MSTICEIDIENTSETRSVTLASLVEVPDHPIAKNYTAPYLVFREERLVKNHDGEFHTTIGYWLIDDKTGPSTRMVYRDDEEPLRYVATDGTRVYSESVAGRVVYCMDASGNTDPMYPVRKLKRSNLWNRYFYATASAVAKLAFATHP